MQSLVNGGLEEGLEERNSTMLMWVTQNYGADAYPVSDQFDYFTGYFSKNYGGYYDDDRPLNHFTYVYAFSVGIVNLKTGVLMDFRFSDTVPTVSELLAHADTANH